MDDHAIDIAGVTAVLGRFPDRVSLVDPHDDDIDVVLYGAREHHAGHDAELHALLRRNDATVIVLRWGAGERRLDWALACGAHGRLSKTMPGSDLVAGLEEINRQRDRARVLSRDAGCTSALQMLGLTPREREVLTLITQGLTNQEIADLVYLSINSVKTYVRSAYRKLGLTRRSQAVSWGLLAGIAQAPAPEPEPAY